MPLLIAEIGNLHDGNLKTAKEMIRIAKESGADLVKSQAFLAKDLNGSMPKDFYKKCEFTFDEHLELIYYADEVLKIPMFNSIFSTEYEDLNLHQTFIKIAGGQSSNKDYVNKRDTFRAIISLKENSYLPQLKRARVLHVSDYLTTCPNLERIRFLSELYKRPCGYSDHTVGIDTAINAVKVWDANVIEKHFTLTRDIKFKGKQFRDAIHAALPKELETLAKTINK